MILTGCAGGLGLLAPSEGHFTGCGQVCGTLDAFAGDDLINLCSSAAFFNVVDHFEYTAESSSEDHPLDGSVGLKLYARDDRNRLVRNDELIAHPLDKGPAQGGGDRDHRFTVTLGPGRSVSVFLAGQSQATARPGRAGNCSLEISGLSMEVTTRAAPAPRTASDEQG